MEQNITQTVQAGSENVLVKKLGIVLSVFVFLIPIFFVPAESVSLYVAKVTLFATGLVVVFAIFLASVLSKGIIEIPKAKYLLPLTFFGVVSLISSVFSGSIENSISGLFFDLSTSGLMIMFIFSLFLTVVAIKNINTVGKVSMAFVYSSMALVVYTILGSLFGSYLPASIASKMPLLLSGGAVDTSIILGAAIILSLCAINMIEMSKKIRYAMIALVVGSLVFVGAANFMPVVILLGVGAMILFVYILSWSISGTASDLQNNRKISLSSLGVLMISVVFLLGGSGIGVYLSQILKIQVTEIRPSFESTMNLTVKAWQKNIALGVGPNRFVNFWAQNKPLDINQTQFWNSDFYSGSGFIPTVAITTGLLGLLSILVFMGMYLLSGIKSIFAQAGNNYNRYLTLSTFLVSLYLWIVMFLYTPGLPVVALTFIFTGLFTATLAPQGVIGLWKINIFSNPKTNFLSVLAIVVILVMSVVGGYFVWERSIASVIFQQAMITYQTKGDVQATKQLIARSINITPRDVYWRGLAEVILAELGKNLSGISNQSQITDDTKAQIQSLIGGVVESSKNAVNGDSGNFQNWFALARVYEILAQNGIPGSIDSARSTYAEASLRSPNNPAVSLALARLDVLENKLDSAKENIGKSLNLKSNYSDAYFTLAQIQAAEKDIPAATKSVEALITIDPTNSGLYFQLGLLKYNQKDFVGAATAFEKSIKLVPDYANAKYFLGIVYYQQDRKDDAVKLFTELSDTNKDNKEVSAILEIMKSGKSLFQESKSVTKPEKRVEPPIKD